MGGRSNRNNFGAPQKWYDTNPRWGYYRGGEYNKIQSFGRTHGDAPPPAKGQSYSSYEANYNKSHPATLNLPANAKVGEPTVLQPPAPGTNTKPEFIGPVLSNPTTSTTVGPLTSTSTIGGPAAPTTPASAGQTTPAPAGTPGAVGTTSTMGQAPMGPQISGGMPTAGTGTNYPGIGGTQAPMGPQPPAGPKGPAGPAVDPTQQLNQAPTTANTGPASVAAGINPRAAAGIAARANQNTSTANNWAMPNMNGLKFGGY